jgi:hypothetical protein
MDDPLDAWRKPAADDPLDAGRKPAASRPAVSVRPGLPHGVII